MLWLPPILVRTPEACFILGPHLRASKANSHKGRASSGVCRRFDIRSHMLRDTCEDHLQLEIFGTDINSKMDLQGLVASGNFQQCEPTPMIAGKAHPDGMAVYLRAVSTGFPNYLYSPI